MSDFKNTLDEYNTNFYLVLERYKTSYPLWKSTGNEEYNNLYLESRTQLETIFKDLFLLENEIKQKADAMNGQLQDSNETITQLKSAYNMNANKLKNTRNLNLASFPLKREFRYQRFQSSIDLVYYLIGFFVISYFLWKEKKLTFSDLKV